MSKIFKRDFLFKNIDKILYCAEHQEQYCGAKLNPFYYNTEKQIKLFHGDALELLKKFPDNCIDMIFADPPYFGNQSGLKIKRQDRHGETFETQKAKWAYPKSLDYQFKFHQTWLKEA